MRARCIQNSVFMCVLCLCCVFLIHTSFSILHLVSDSNALNVCLFFPLLSFVLVVSVVVTVFVIVVGGHVYVVVAVIDVTSSHVATISTNVSIPTLLLNCVNLYCF